MPKPDASQEPRVGVYVCHCGLNIAGVVDCAAVAQYAAGLPAVVVARDDAYCCSEPGQKLIQAEIAEHGLNRVVVASCSPRLHEPTFRACLAGAGLNPYLLEMANLREQCAWVHAAEPAAATAKAQDLVRSAVARARGLMARQEIQAPVARRALVIGGGVAGIQAALDIADGGHEVVLVEREPSIGGHMAEFDKTFPTLDCAACILTPKMVDVGRHPKIHLYTYSEVEKVDGYIGNFKLTVRKHARFVDTSKCTGCGECARPQVCFVRAISMQNKRPIRSEICVGCGRCVEVCPHGALSLVIEDTRFIEETIYRLAQKVDVTPAPPSAQTNVLRHARRKPKPSDTLT